MQVIPVTSVRADDFTITLLGRGHTVDAIAISMNDVADEGRRKRRVEEIGNHMIASLRLAYNPETDGIRNGEEGCLNLLYESDNPVPEYTAIIRQTVNQDHVVDYHAVAAVFCESARLQLEPIISLLAEAAMPALPVHYRVLSLWRAFELLVPERTRREVLDRYDAQFATIGVSQRRFYNAMPEIRNRCAHGVGTGAANPLVAQVYPELRELHQLVALLRTVVFDCLREERGLELVLRAE